MFVIVERCNESVRLGLLVQAMQALAAGLRLAAAHYRSRTLQPTPQVRNGMDSPLFVISVLQALIVLLRL